MTNTDKEILDVPAKTKEDHAKNELHMVTKFVSELHKKVFGYFPNKGQSAIDTIKDIYHFMDNIIAVAPSNIYWLTKNNVYLGCNEEHAKRVGLTRKRIIGRTNFDLPWSSSAYKLNKINNDVTKYNKKITTEESGFIISGKYSIVLTEKAPLYNRSGDIIGVIGVSIDITDRKKVEMLEKEAKERAEKTARFMEATSAAIAHELSTPLAIINLQMDYLAKALETGSFDSNKNKNFFQQTIGTVKNIVNSAAYMISNVLIKMRSLVTGKIDNFDFKNYNIISDIENVLNIYPFGDVERNLVNLQIANEFEYFGSKLLTEHVLFNLLKNALRAIKQARHGEIFITLENKNDHNELIFRDTALGIPKEFIPNIFNQFETKEKNGKGTGLGLAFCKLVMESYGGSITCNSKEGEYTEFVLSFSKLQSAKTINFPNS